MRDEPRAHRRRSLRLAGYDYARAGAYFVTVVVDERELLLSQPAVAAMVLRWWDELPRKFPSVDTDAFVVMPNHVHGIVVIGSQDAGGEHMGGGGEHAGSPQRMAGGVEVDGGEHMGGGGEHAGSPQRMAGGVEDHVGADLRVGPAVRDVPNLGRVMQWFKTMTTNEYIRGVKHSDWRPFQRRFWQRNYYERIIRNEDELNRIRQYIADNPARWEQDGENPQRQP